MNFVKMHGLGNDYVYLNLFEGSTPADPSSLARQISDRHRGVGSDGLILVEPSDQADARMRMFNRDGSESEMCGNGIRCVAKLIADEGIATGDRVTIETGRGLLTLDLEREYERVVRVRVDMGRPILEADAIPTTLPGSPVLDALLDAGDDLDPMAITAVSMGNPHAVVFLDPMLDLETYPVAARGALLERHPTFPNKTNVHFVQRLAKDEVRMRTWERGSGLTLACGTGACAVCVAGVLTQRTARRITAHLPGGPLDLEWPDPSGSVFMTGPAVEVFRGQWTD